MCCFVHPMWRTFVLSTNSCSRQLCTSSVMCWYSRPCLLTRQSAKHLSNFYRRPTYNIVRSLLCSSSLSTTASYELTGFRQHDFCDSSLPSVALHHVVLKTSPTLHSSFHCSKATVVGHQNHLNLHQSRHYIPRQLTSSTKTIVDASPLSLQPYLRLIRFDRPIGIVMFISCLFD